MYNIYLFIYSFIYLFIYCFLLFFLIYLFIYILKKKLYKTTFSRMSEIFSYTRCPKLSKSSYLFGGCFADETWGFTSLTSPVCACSLRVMEKSNWAMDTEAATSENWGKRLFGGTYSHWESWENWKNGGIWNYVHQKKGEWFILEEWEVAICDGQFILPVNG